VSLGTARDPPRRSPLGRLRVRQRGAGLRRNLVGAESATNRRHQVAAGAAHAPRAPPQVNMPFELCVVGTIWIEEAAGEPRNPQTPVPLAA